MSSAIATTKMSSKGQVVIPEEIRNRLNLNSGTKFIVLGEGDSVILKSITPPKISDFRRMMDEAQAQARKVGLKKSNIDEVIKEVRQSRRRG
jgi:AbrB family looped-hinge helix DNA binding protein